MSASTQAIIGNLTGDNPDPEAAFSDLIDIPAGMADAFLNGGQSLDLTPVLAALGPVLGVELPEGTKIGVAMGGLLSPGGSAFNALDITIEALGFPLTIAGQGPGAIGSLIGLSKVIAAAITPADQASLTARPPDDFPNASIKRRRSSACSRIGPESKAEDAGRSGVRDRRQAHGSDPNPFHRIGSERDKR